jgi:hypothetical protein
MVQKFGEWRLIEARTYSDENFDKVINNIGAWMAKALDPRVPPGKTEDAKQRVLKIKRMLTTDPTFKEFMDEEGFTLSSDFQTVAGKVLGLGDFLNRATRKESNDFLASLKSAADGWMWHQLLADPGKVPGKRGRPAGSKNLLADPGKVPGKRGRPAGSKNKSPRTASPVSSTDPVTIELESPVTAGALAKALGVNKRDIVSACSKLGYDVTKGKPLDSHEHLVDVIAEEFGKTVTVLPGSQEQLDRIESELRAKKKRILDLDDEVEEAEAEVKRVTQSMYVGIKKLTRERESVMDEVMNLENQRRALQVKLMTQQKQPAKRRGRKPGSSPW